RAGLRTLHRMLKPGGVLLATFPGISKIELAEDWGTSWHWSFTERTACRLFAETFPKGEVKTETWGNVLSATAFLWGFASSRIADDKLKYRDPEYPGMIGVRAVKAKANP